MSHIKIAIYGDPGVGKSTFAAKAPKPFFITTDGNYEYLESFCGLLPEDHIQVESWKEFKDTVAKWDFDPYETIVVDLVEDTYLWATNEFCKENKITHLSDLGYGKGYEVLGQDFFITYNKLFALPKNIILIFHGVSETKKDRRGVEYTKYSPSNYVREKLLKQIEGRVRFFLRAYAEMKEADNGRLKVERYLSLSPDGNSEYGVARGLSEDAPTSIPLDWDTFVSVTGIDITPSASAPKKIEKPKITATSKKVAPVKEEPEKAEEPKEETTPLDEIKSKLEEVLSRRGAYGTPSPAKSAPVEEKVEEVEEITPEEEKPVQEEKSSVTTGISSNEDKLAAIKAKMAALKAKSNG